MILDEKLVEEAAAVAQGRIGDGRAYVWSFAELPEDSRARILGAVRSAIAHYLENRPLPEQFRDAARILRSGCEPGVEDSRWSPAELEAHADALEDVAVARREVTK